MPLTMINLGETVRIQKITGKDDVRLHLENLGLAVGQEVTLVSEIAGNVILNIKDSRVALEKSIANRILV